ncbi:MAG: T9SS type A sorting domain-containing protein, partial [Candidatus Latescibacterota bacterium]
YDVLGPSSLVGNTLASRVKNVQQQIIDPYQIILWNTSELSDGLAGDGGVWSGGNSGMKPDDFGLFKTFLDGDPDNPGIYVAGDDFAEKWVGLTGANAIAVRSTYMNYILLSGDHRTYGEMVSPLVAQSMGSPIGPSSMIAVGGCPILNDFDVAMPLGTAFEAMAYAATASGAVLAQATPTAQSTTARMVLSGFGYNFIRDDEEVPQANMDRVIHLRDILTWFGLGVGDPVGIETVAYENRLNNAYPNPFNPTTTIRYSIAERGMVILRIYNVAGQLVRTLVSEVQSPTTGGFSEIWDGLNDDGQSVSSGVYYCKLVANGFAGTKKLVLLK